MSDDVSPAAVPEKDKSAKTLTAHRVVWHFAFHIVSQAPAKTIGAVATGAAVLRSIRKAGVDPKAKVSEWWSPMDGMVNENDPVSIETTSEQRLLLRRCLTVYVKAAPIVQGALLTPFLLELGGEFEGATD